LAYTCLCRTLATPVTFTGMIKEQMTW
jgi:hypothetical protein